MNRGAEKSVAVILAAGQGTRMRSSLPKVLHAVGGQPMLQWVVDAASAAGCRNCFVIVGHGAEQVRATIDGQGIEWVVQQEQRGTGHALAQVEDHLRVDSTLLVLSGDVPLVSPDTLRGLLEAARSSWGAMAVAEVDEPGSLGRVVVAPNGSLEGIVEAADASSEELEIRRVNAGIYALPAPEIFSFLEVLEPDNAKGELYLTDALTAAARSGRGIAVVDLADPSEALGVNTRSDLAVAHRALSRRRAEQLMVAGVTLFDPDRITIEARVEVAQDTTIHPGVSLLGETVVGPGCILHQGVWLRDTTLAEGVEVHAHSVLEGARVDAECQIGPFARLRPGAVIERGAKVGNFVEVKNSRLGEGVKANHLAYIGDATVAEGANLGAGVVTCNYDGKRKHQTRIGRHAFIGSDTMLIAPVEVGDEAMTAAGSVISEDVPPGSLGIERGSQRNLAGWAKRFRRRKKK